MRILVLGAGAVGGYFGGRLAAAGRDVTFLVRPQRAALLAERGLVVASPLGDYTVRPKLVTADRLAEPYELVIVSAKHYDLDQAIAALEDDGTIGAANGEPVDVAVVLRAALRKLSKQ